MRRRLGLSVAWGYGFGVLLMLFIFLILMPEAEGPSPWDGDAFKKGILEMAANFRILDELADLRNQKIGFIFQTFNLIPVLTAYENVEFPLLLKKGGDSQERKSRVIDALSEVGLEDLIHRRPNELSGGQQQRVAIARALIKKPKLILADEPTANLDSQTGKSVLEIMYELNRKNMISFVFPTHDKMVMDFANRLIILKDGLITEDNEQSNH